MANFIEILHNNPKITTLQGFVDDNFIKLDSTFTLQNLLNYEGNAGRIKSSYFTNSSEAANVNRLETPTLLRVPSDRVTKEIVATAGNVVVPNRDFATFLSNEIKNLLQNPSYKPINRTPSINNRNTKTYRIYNNATVWCYCKAMGTIEEEGRLVNLTPFVENITVNSNKNGGNFSVKLLPVMSRFDRSFSYEPGQGWEIDNFSLGRYFFREQENFIIRKSVFDNEDGELKRNKLFFDNVITSNDVVFIAFETLELEKEDREEDIFGSKTLSTPITVSTSQLAGRNWDMIALVDEVKTTYNAQNADLSVEVVGRDLMKLLIEDGCYFFPLDFATENGGFINASASNSGSLKRLVNGELPFFNAYVDRTIEFTIRFIFNQLANIKICSDELFRYYPERVYKYDILNDTPETQQGGSVNSNPYVENTNNFKRVEAPGIWQSIRVSIDDEILNRRIVDASISSDSGSLLSFIQKVCQDPFVEFWGDTYGDKFYFIARKPPFTGRAIKDYIDEGLVIDVLEDDIYNESLSWNDGEVYSWYRITPKGNFFGDGSGLTLSEFPAIFFEEYANIWGSRPLQVVSNYIDYQGYAGSDKPVNLDFLRKQAIQDLAYLIEIHSYLPFTRKGTITIKGDRRIKKGIFIRHKGTNEIFYVDSVNQTYTSGMSNDRNTILQVSRGMVEDLLDTNGEISYFNIVDLDKDPLSGVSRSNNFRINKSVFDYFIKRRQKTF